MDENIDIKKINYMKLKSDALVDNICSSSDADLDDREANNSRYGSRRGIVDSQLEYRNKLVANLQNERAKISKAADNCERRPKYSRHTISIKNDVVQNVHKQMANNDSPDLSRSTTNYKTICDELDGKATKDSISIGNKLNTSGFLSMSRQSLNDTLNVAGISNTASRISGNFLKRNSSQPQSSPQDAPNQSQCLPKTLSSRSYAFRSRRYRTIVKQDKFSSYLTRVAAKDDSLFSAPPPDNSIGLSIDLGDVSAVKRIDFSKIVQFHKARPATDKTESTAGNSDIVWMCANCDSSNPSNFNFCPTCSAANPKLTSFAAKKRSFSSSNDRAADGWLCSRCATKNDAIRAVCVFCFRSKDELSNATKKRRLGRLVDAWTCPGCMEENETDWNACVRCLAINPAAKRTSNGSSAAEEDKDAQKPIFKFGSNDSSTGNSDLSTGNVKFGIEKDKDAQKPIFKFGTDDSSAGSSDLSTGNKLFGSRKEFQIPAKIVSSLESSPKWTCDTCLVENDADRDSCACCTSANPTAKKATSNAAQSLFKFGNADSLTGNIKFATPKENNDAQKSTFKFGSNKSPAKTAANLKPQPKWMCDTCLVENDADRDSCACCTSANPAAKKAIPNASQSLFKFGNADSSTGNIKFGSDGSSTGNGVLSTANIKFGTQNENNDAQKSIFKFGSNCSSAGSNTDSLAGTIKSGAQKENNEAQKSIFKIGSNKSPVKTAANLKSQPKWACDTCLVENDADRDSCACCTASRPSTKQAKAAPAQTSCTWGPTGNSQGKSLDQWTCPGCWVENSASTDSCPCCLTGRPAAAVTTTTANTDASTTQHSSAADSYQYTFSPPESLGIAACADVPVDLVFEFCDPLSL